MFMNSFFHTPTHHTELPHNGKWHMVIWPEWLGNHLGTDKKTLALLRNAEAHTC